MPRNLFLMLLFVSTALSINRPVYKIVLTQKGFAQFLQYDIETPPIREFTFCTWIRVFDLSNDQSVFTYVANGNNRVLRLWLDTGGRYINVSINGRTSSSAAVDITKDTWRHLCFSFQSDFGAWAVYVDGRLAFCESAQSLYGFVLPASGSVIIGYGTTANGNPNGFEGEIFGANMILISTIERNFTIKQDPKYRQKSFRRNKVMNGNNIRYIVLNDMSLDTSTVTSRQEKLPLKTNTSYVNKKHAYELTNHEMGLRNKIKRTKSIDVSSEKEIFDFLDNDNKDLNNDNGNINFWNLVNDARNLERKTLKPTEITGSGTQERPAVSEFETPPPISFQRPLNKFNFNQPPLKSFYDINEKENRTYKQVNFNKYQVSDVETPPSPDKTPKVYGQWTSSQFANSVLNYIKNINLKNREQKKIPATIPLFKLSDSFPYASDFKISKVRPSYKFQKNKFMDRRTDIHKRDVAYPQINVKILRNDLRGDIIEEHAKTKPKNIEIINRGEPNHNKDHRFYRNVDNQVITRHVLSSEGAPPHSLAVAPIQNIKKKLPSFDLYKNSNLMTILPFLKSAEYFMGERDNLRSISSNDMYTKSLSNANKWHNVKSYNNDYTPRQIGMISGNINNNIDTRIAEANKKHPSLRLKYMPENHKVVKSVDEDAIVEGRALALEISNISNFVPETLSILKYNHGYLPAHGNILRNTNQLNPIEIMTSSKGNLKQNNFDHHVKLGNALNERHIIGNNKREHTESFIGGDEKIPDIHRYRSEIDNVNDKVPPSLGAKVCKNVEFFDRLFYVQPDDSIDITNILSPVKEKNIAIEFIMQNYKKCTTIDSDFVNNPLLFIDWSKTPVRLFGGAYPKRTTDLCGFF